MSTSPTGRVELEQDARRAMLLMASFALAWVVLEAVVGARLQGHYNPMQVVWSRYAVHLLTLVLLFGWRSPGRLWRTQRPVVQLSRSLMMLVMPYSFALSVGLGVPPDTVWGVFWFAPLLIIAIAQVALGERAPAPVWIVAALGAVAASLVHPPRPASPLLLLLPVAMCLSFSVYVVMTRTLRDEPVLANLFYTALGVFLVLTPLMPRIWVTPSPHDTLLLIGIGTLGLVALFALDRAVAGAPVPVTAPVLYLHLVFLALVGVLLHQGAPSRRAVVGAAFIAAIVAGLWWQWPRAAGTALAEDPVR